MTKYGLLIDNYYCTGCHSCEVACKNELGLPLGQWGIKVLQLGPWKKDEDSWEFKYIPTPTSSCNLCADRVARGEKPSCVLHCLASAIEFGPVTELAAIMAEREQCSSIFTI